MLEITSDGAIHSLSCPLSSLSLLVYTPFNTGQFGIFPPIRNPFTDLWGLAGNTLEIEPLRK
jgi:hypothetical protein